ncbi:deoxyguanosinetriphosphate triphosphohydrolase family protein [Methanoregula sp.]|uniref:deoxyguanosinetriphosphate triphosphohydrolase family protein n=1 Tax=Methanoregula sp. TaxID=2052170 RepID=UPI000CC00728|nr:HD domain-containing protein [Methanoregula sp.]PKG33680.1 MAG: phosphohydrolase [Methanoregula sp.]
MKRLVRKRLPDPERASAIRALTMKREALLSPLATTSADAVRRYDRELEDIRTPYSRDADRIIHTRAYTRYIDKTQVFYLVDNDHITHRVIHVQLVSKIARTIGRSLRLNEDLIEAIALGHDIGHIPYGHFGESCLSALCEQQGIGRFSHNVQSVRFLDQIEDCDLTMQVLDGILCHNGEADDIRIAPESLSGWAAFDRKVQENADGRRSRPPMTLEGCVVKFADTIAYIGRDLQDARDVGLIDDRTAIPSKARDVLGSTNREIINTLIYDLLENSDTEEKGFISYSHEVEQALITLRAFSRQHIYDNPKLTAERKKIQRMYYTLFSSCLESLEQEETTAKIYTDFINTRWTNKRYLETATLPELVRDFIAGMTDRYFAKRYEECVIPRRVEGKFR